MSPKFSDPAFGEVAKNRFLVFIRLQEIDNLIRKLEKIQVLGHPSPAHAISLGQVSLVVNHSGFNRGHDEASCPRLNPPKRVLRRKCWRDFLLFDLARNFFFFLDLSGSSNFSSKFSQLEVAGSHEAEP